MESIMDVLAIPQQQQQQQQQNNDDSVANNSNNNPYEGDQQPYRPDDTDPHDNYDDSPSHGGGGGGGDDNMLVMNNDGYQPVPAPPGHGNDDGNDEMNGGGGGDDGGHNDNGDGGNGDVVAVNTQQSEMSGTKDGETNGATNGHHQSSSNNGNRDNRRRRGSRSRSRNEKKDRSRSRSRSRSNNNNRRRRGGGGGRRSRSPRRRGGRGRSPGGGGGHRSSIKNDKDNLKYRWDRTIFVSNIPYEVKWAELKDLFREKVGDSAVVYCEIYERQSDGKSLGVGTIEFRTVADAERAIELMHSFEMDGRKLSVRMDAEGFKARQSREMAGYGSSSNRGGRMDSPDRGGGRGSGGGGGHHHNSHASHHHSGGGGGNSGILGMLGLGGSGLGLGATNSNLNNPQWLNALAAQNGIEGPVTKRIFVASLDYKVDEHKLREVFGMAGRVRSVSLFRDRDNKSRGMALVEYDQPFDALNAVAMFNKQTLLDREMNVRFDTKPPTKEEEQMSSGGSGGSSKLPSGLRSIGSGISGLGNLLAAAATPSPNALGTALGLTSMNPLGLNTPPVSAAASSALTLGALTALAGLNSGGLGGSGSNPLAAAAAASNSLSSAGMGSGRHHDQGNMGNSNNDGMGNGYGMSSSASSMLNSFMDAVSARTQSMNGGGSNNSMNNSMNSNNGMSKMDGGKTRITKIFIKNLPFSWDERRLKEKFSQAGRIEYAEIKKKDGKSRGFGMVRYSYPDQADKAVELFNGSNFDGRTLEVKLDLM